MPKMRLEAASEACMCPGGNRVYILIKNSQGQVQKRRRNIPRGQVHTVLLYYVLQYMLQQENSRATDEGPLLKRTRLVSYKVRPFSAFYNQKLQREFLDFSQLRLRDRPTLEVLFSTSFRRSQNLCRIEDNFLVQFVHNVDFTCGH